MSAKATNVQGCVNSTWITEGLCFRRRKIDPLQSFLYHEIHDGAILCLKLEDIVKIISMVQWGTVKEVDSVGIFTKSIKNRQRIARFRTYDIPYLWPRQTVELTVWCAYHLLVSRTYAF